MCDGRVHPWYPSASTVSSAPRSVWRPFGAATGGEGSSLAELRVVVPAVAGSNPVLHPIDAMHRPARAPAVHVNDRAGVAELVDALDLGSGELCSWRFKSSHPHQQAQPRPPHDKTAVRSATAAPAGRSSDRRRIHSEDEGQPYRRE